MDKVVAGKRRYLAILEVLERSSTGLAKGGSHTTLKRKTRKQFTQLAIAWIMLGLIAIALAVLPASSASAAPAGLTSSEVSFRTNGGVTLHGTVVASAAPEEERRPAIVMLGGAGPVTREELQAEAEAYARHGIVSLIYDKRTVGYSMLHRDYSVLADDALAGVQVLRGRDEVDPARVGIWGQSEGAWVAPLAASRSADFAFVITVGAIGVTPARQQAWAYGEHLGHAGVSGSLLHTMQVTGTRQLVGAGLFAEANYDPVPVWERVHQPVLALWGTLDREAVPEESSQIIQRALQRGGNTHYTIRFISGARHNLNRTFDDGFDRPDSLTPNYGDQESSWVHDLAHGLPTASAEPAPHQDQHSIALAPLAWYESRWVQLGAFVMFSVGFGGYPLTAGVRRIRGRRDTTPAQRSARWLVVTSLATVLGFVVYFLFMVVTAANLVGPVFVGRPVPWLVLQLLAGSVVVATIATAGTWRRHRHEVTGGSRVRLGLLLAAGVVFVPSAAYWGLLIP